MNNSGFGIAKITDSKNNEVDKSIIPIGVYTNLMLFGYGIQIPINGEIYNITTQIGIRGKCNVTMEVSENNILITEQTT